MLADLQGQIERITYTNDETGYTIAKIKVYGRRDLVTVVGNFMAPMPGEILKMQGEWANHPKFGEQFKVVHYKSLVPASVAGIEKYLGSGLIKGIGPVMAKRIVKKFKKETLDVIEQEVEKRPQGLSWPNYPIISVNKLLKWSSSKGSISMGIWVKSKNSRISSSLSGFIPGSRTKILL